MTTTFNCNICSRTLVTTLNIKCNYCEQSACTQCHITFLLGLDDPNPRCMYPTCKKTWTFQFMSSNFDSHFINDTLLSHQTNIYIQREKSLLPGAMNILQIREEEVQRRLNVANLHQERRILQQKINDAHKILTVKKVKINSRDSVSISLYKCPTCNIPTVFNDICARCGSYYSDSQLKFTDHKQIEMLQSLLIYQDHLLLKLDDVNQKEKKEKKEKKVYVKNCPNNECRGFLNNEYNCELCKVKTCKHCSVIKSDDEHKCNPDTLATIKLLATDTKQCPKCTSLIYKINGCDQMYCTHCHTPFSWIRGTIETGVVHNPHYYELQRKLNNGVIPRVNGDQQCGGIIILRDLRRKLGVYLDEHLLNNHHRLLLHITHVELPYYQRNDYNEKLLEYRIQYLKKNINDEKWFSLLKKHYKCVEKKSEIYMVLRMFCDMLTNIFNNISVSNSENDMIHHIASLDVLRTYTNDLLTKVKHHFRSKMKTHIQDNWGYVI